MEGKVMFRVKRDKQAFFVGPDVEPVMEVPDGATVIFETVDCFREVVVNPEDCFSSYGECLKVMDVPCMNPVTGPIAIQGASPGDFLAVEILDIKLPEKGATSYIPNLGMFSSLYQLSDDLVPDTRICKIEGDYVYLPTNRGDIKIPVSPMIGTISIAPKQEKIASFKFGAEHLGNVDCKEIAKGNKLILPINIEGGLLAMGDVHAVQGDGEISCVAVEISADVTVKIDILASGEAQFAGCPQINGDDFIGSIGCHFGNTIGENIKYAYFDLIQRLKKYYGFSVIDAYHLLSQVGEVRVCQVLGDHQAALAKVSRRFIE
jgi:acetamidase/formamidase